MNTKYKNQTIKYIEKQIADAEEQIQIRLARLRADLEVLKNNEIDVPTWHGYVHSAWVSEGEPSWNGSFKAATPREAVYTAMLEFCKNAHRVYPGQKKGSTEDVYDHFDVQGSVSIYLELPNGTTIPVDDQRVKKLKEEFNRKAPMPPKPPRRKPTGIV